LGHVEGEGWHSIRAYPDAVELPGIVVFRWEAPLFFANARAFREQVRRLVAERHPTWVVIQCEAITDVDVTAADTLAQLDEELNASDVHIAMAEMRSRLQDLTQRYGLFETIHHDRFFPSVESAIDAIREERP
jgi:MFS superfamily sulfate permease-like transporter